MCSCVCVQKGRMGADDEGCFIHATRVRASGLAVQYRGTDPGGGRHEVFGGEEADDGSVGGLAEGTYRFSFSTFSVSVIGL